MAPILAFVEMLVSVNFAPETSAPVWSFTEPAMLPVGEAETAGANTKASPESIIPKMLDILVFFFQAEGGIRDLTVTGVQTCALPISSDLSTPITGHWPGGASVQGGALC